MRWVVRAASIRLLDGLQLLEEIPQSRPCVDEQGCHLPAFVIEFLIEIVVDEGGELVVESVEKPDERQRRASARSFPGLGPDQASAGIIKPFTDDVSIGIFEAKPMGGLDPEFGGVELRALVFLHDGVECASVHSATIESTYAGATSDLFLSSR